MFKLNPLFSNGVIFQRDCPIRIFGEGRGKIRAEFLGEAVEAVADGSFCLTLSAHEAGGPYELRVTDGESEAVVTNVMIGEVILLAGQSNGALTVAETFARDTVFAPDSNVRLYKTATPCFRDDGTATPEQGGFNSCWTELATETAQGWSAIALHTARYFAKKLGMAVGVITCCVGATAIRSFISEATYARFDVDEGQLMSDHHNPLYSAWNKTSFLYNFMVKTLFPFRVSSVIWYQGESDRTVYEGTFYDKLLMALVDEWREKFELPELPFAVVQINLHPVPAEEGNIAIREAQARAVKQILNSRLVRIDDLGEHENIHPENKEEVSLRICKALEEFGK